MLELYEILLETAKERVKEDQKSGTITTKTIEMIKVLEGLYHFAAKERKAAEAKAEVVKMEDPHNDIRLGQ